MPQTAYISSEKRKHQGRAHLIFLYIYIKYNIYIYLLGKTEGQGSDITNGNSGGPATQLSRDQAFDKKKIGNVGFKPVPD